MKTTAFPRRMSARSLKTSPLTSNHGHVAVKRPALAISSRVAEWLPKPKPSLIAGQWVAAASGKTLDVFNPADASLFSRAPDSDREDINRAVAAARRAFEPGP